MLGLLERTGRAMAAIGEEIIQTVSFTGQTLGVLARLAVRPRRIRWVSVVHVMEVAGFNALPIVSLLSFFIGLVVAYLGARILGDFGASVFTVELVAFSMLREFGVVITAVLLAGRTNSAFTAEIGAMKMRQEIDAMRVIGIDPMEALVAPRVIAMLVMTPLLTFAAMIAGLFGGLLVAWAELGVSPTIVLHPHRRRGAGATFLGWHVEGAGVCAGAGGDRLQAGAVGRRRCRLAWDGGSLPPWCNRSSW